MLCFVSQLAGPRAGRPGHSQQAGKERVGQAPDLQVQKVSVLGFGWFGACCCMLLLL